MGTSSLTCNKTTGQQLQWWAPLHLYILRDYLPWQPKRLREKLTNSDLEFIISSWSNTLDTTRLPGAEKKRVCRNRFPIEHPLFNKHSSWVWTLFDEVLQSNTFFGVEAQQFKRILASSQWYLFRAGPRTRLLFDDCGTLCCFSSWLYVVKFLDCYVL